MFNVVYCRKMVSGNLQLKCFNVVYCRKMMTGNLQRKIKCQLPVPDPEVKDVVV